MIRHDNRVKKRHGVKRSQFSSLQIINMSLAIVDELNAHIAQGHPLLIYLRVDHAPHTSSGEEEKQEEYLIKKVGLEPVEFMALKRALKVNDEATALLLSPTGKVLSCSVHMADVEKEAERFETCVAMAVIENTLEEVPVRRTADEWIKVCAEQNESAFTVLQRLTQAEGTAPAQISRNVKPVRNPPDANSPQSIPAATPSEESGTGRKLGKATKVAIRYSNGAPRQIIDVDNTTTMRFRDLIRRLSVNVESLTVEYPRKELTVTEHGSLTLDELNLNANPSLLAKVPGSIQNNLVAGRDAGGKSVKAYLEDIASLFIFWFMWIIGLMKSLFQPRIVHAPQAVRAGALRGPVPQATENREQEKKKPNQYWNGDSTVFESPDDGSSSQ